MRTGTKFGNCSELSAEALKPPLLRHFGERMGHQFTADSHTHLLKEIQRLLAEQSRELSAAFAPLRQNPHDYHYVSQRDLIELEAVCIQRQAAPKALSLHTRC